MPSISLAHDARLEYVRQELVKAGYDKKAASTLVHDKRIKVYAVKKVSYKQPNWGIIESKFYNVDYIQQGKNYIISHSATFEKAETDYDVKKEVIAGIIAIETDFGKNSGSYITFNTLYSRMKQASSTKWKAQAVQLMALSKYCLEEKLDCFSIKGSYAGALGIVQFMPNSLLTYGIDGNADGVVDLFNPEDAVPSAANFLKKHGWDQDQLKSLARYYGSSVGYPQIVLTYAGLIN